MVEFIHKITLLNILVLIQADCLIIMSPIKYITIIMCLSPVFCQVIEDPVEIIDNERELKGFHNIDEVIKLVGYFKNEKSARTLTPELQSDRSITLKINLWH